MEKKIFVDFNFTHFWDDTEYALKEYVEDYPNDDLIKSIEEELGYKFPESYIELMRLHNGGIPVNTCYPTREKTSWAHDHVAITAIMAIGRSKIYSVCGELGSPYMIDMWDYPDTGIYICDCPSAGHDMIMLDYTNGGKNGEPEVVDSSAIKTCLYANPKWIPFATGRNGDYLLYDMDPGEKGTYGQIIELQNESWKRKVIAKSFTTLIENEIELIKKGHLKKYDFILGKNNRKS